MQQLWKRFRRNLDKIYFAEVAVGNPLVALNSADFLRLLRKENLWSLTDWLKVLSNAADELSGRRPGTAMYQLQQNRPQMWTPQTAAPHPLGADFAQELEEIKNAMAEIKMRGG